MSSEAMEVDPSENQSLEQKTEALQRLATGPLSSSLAKLSGSSRGIPSHKDFHFYYNFNEFKVPVKEIAKKSKLMLDAIGSSVHLWGKEMGFLEDLDEAYECLVNVNDEVLERFDVSADEFQRLRKKEEETGVRMMDLVDSESGFQLVYGKKKKGVDQVVETARDEDSRPSAVKVVSRDKKVTGTKPKVPFHIPSIPRPQDEYKIVVNNSNQPFEHVWLQRSEDGSRFMHPQEKFSFMDFVDKDVELVEPVKPPPIEATPFKFVEEVRDLKLLAAKLHGINEFAVDLEHNQYRSFQGLTCLMQISTRNEDFIVDTLKLRLHIGPYLREVFKDPTKKKVMHGADRDILWLQRDFGIYVCNMFDTGQASRVLKLERNSLEYLLSHFSGVAASKEYQNADWRLRPLPYEMIKYAREDTHYLLYIYDLLRIRLLATPSEAKTTDLLAQVYKRSYDLCMQLYEKELLTDTSYLYIYGLQVADFNAQQLAIVAGLCEWRDVIARAEDESTGYILPNKILLEVAKQMPFTISNLRRLLKSKHPYVEKNLSSVVSIIRHSVQNASAFEAAAEHLKERRLTTQTEENLDVANGSEAPPAEAAATATGMRSDILGNDGRSGFTPISVRYKGSLGLKRNTIEIGKNEQVGAAEPPDGNGIIKNRADKTVSELLRESLATSGEIVGTNVSDSATGAIVLVQKKPSHAFGTMLGNSSTKRKLDPDKREKEEMKLEQIKSSMNLPFHSFVGRTEQVQSLEKGPTRLPESIHDEQPSAMPATISKVEEIICLESDSDIEESEAGEAADEPSKEYGKVDSLKSGKNIIYLESDSDVEEPISVEAANEQSGEHGKVDSLRPGLEMDEGDETVSLSDLSSSFQKCFQSMNQTREPKQAQKSSESIGLLQLKPFDYEDARKQFRIGAKSGEREEGDGDDEGRKNRKKSSVLGQVDKEEGAREISQGRRRQAFPASGNRSATFR